MLVFVQKKLRELPNNLVVVVLTVPVGNSENYFYLVERSELK